jgi:hypothetical protein
VVFKLCVLALALLVLAPLPAFTQSDATGDWVVTIDTPQGPQTIDATMKQAGEELTGTIVSPLGSVDFKGKMIKDALDIAYTLDIQGNAVEMKMTGTLAGDTITGNLSLGGLGDVPWSAKRKPAGAATTTAAAAAAAPAAAATTATAAAAAAPAAAAAASATGGGVTGKWDVTLNMAGNQMPASANFTQAGDKVTGTLGTQMGEMPVSGTMSGNALKLAFTVETPQGNLEIVMTGDVTGDNIAGKMTLTGLGEGEWTGKRVQ